MATAKSQCEVDLLLIRDAAHQTKAALDENLAQIERVIAAATSGQATGALFDILNDRAASLKTDRERLKGEYRRQMAMLTPLNEHFDAQAFSAALHNFEKLSAAAEPEELKRLIRLLASYRLVP